MSDKDVTSFEEEMTINHKIINEMKHLMNEITHLKIELLMSRLENIDLENEIKELKQKLNVL